MNFYGYVYLTVNLLNGKRYVGQHAKPVFDKRYLGSGLLLRKAIVKYGRKAFVCSPLRWCCSEAELNKEEMLLITLLKPEMNISPGAEGVVGHRHAESTKEKTRQTLMGHSVSAETRAKIGAVSKGRVQSAETREKKRIACTGWKQTEAVKEHLRQVNIGKKLSSETKEKLRQANLGKQHTQGTKDKLRNLWLGKKRPADVVERIRQANKGKKPSALAIAKSVTPEAIAKRVASRKITEDQKRRARQGA